MIEFEILMELSNMSENEKHLVNWFLNDYLIEFSTKQKFLNLLIEKGLSMQTFMTAIEFRSLWAEFVSKQYLGKVY